MILRHFKLKLNFIILGSFLCLAIVSNFVLLTNHLIGNGYDIQFHWNRIAELATSFQHQQFFNDVARYSFSHSGDAVMTMYPKLFLIPIAIAYQWVGFFPLIYYIYVLTTFIGLLLSYWPCYQYNKNHQTAFVFAVGYVISIYNFFYGLLSMNYGTYFAMLFLPGVIFGVLILLRDHHITWFVVSFSGVIYSHILTTVIISSLLLIWSLINCRHWNRLHFIKLTQSFILISLITMGFWLPFIWLYFQNDIFSPADLYAKLQGASIFDILINGVDNGILFHQTPPSLTWFNLFGLIVSISRYRMLKRYQKQFLFISIIYLCLGSQIIPWSLLTNTPLRILQFPWRIFIIPQLLLSILSADQFVAINFKHFRSWILSLTMLLIVANNLTQLTYINNYRQQSKPLKNVFVQNGQINPANLDANHQFSYYLNNNHNFNYVLRTQKISDDYYPKSIRHYFPFLDRQQATAQHLILPVHYYDQIGTLNNFTSHAIHNINYPFVLYHGLKYQLWIDDQKKPIHLTNQHLLRIETLTPGSHTIRIKPQLNPVTIISKLISLLNVLIFSSWQLLKRKR